MHYFFGRVDIENNLAYLEREEAHHCAVVLRLNSGEQIGILNTDGKIYLAQLISVHKKECVGKIFQVKEIPVPQHKVHLVIAPPKNNERLEWLIEKSVELQVWSLHFVLSERCIRKSLNIERLKKIRDAAAKQSANPYLPEIFEYKSLNSFIQHYTTDFTYSNKHLHLILHCYESEKVNLDLALLQKIKNEGYSDIFAYIGPEGDWTIKEIEIMKEKFNPFLEVSLGTIRLRTETAALNVASVIKSLNF
ncbi:MAG: ribosomal RNA small subunit methyltransferase E [Bacteroidia bacterium]|nr:MAG: ribosomal RNA small subunit methyltransferase E [Bacteroidia bacterium]